MRSKFAPEVMLSASKGQADSDYSIRSVMLSPFIHFYKYLLSPQCYSVCWGYRNEYTKKPSALLEHTFHKEIQILNQINKLNVQCIS